MTRKLWIALTIVLLCAVFAAPLQAAAPAEKGDTPPAGKSDNRPDPLTDAQIELRNQALQAKINGKASGKTHEVAKGQFVELERTGEKAVWTVLGQFSDLKHNQIAQPDRSKDNSTLWVSDFSRPHYLDMFFNDAPGANSMRNFYVEQSSNRFTVHGDVTDWVTVPGTAVSYDDNPDANVWNFLRDSVNAWYAEQLAQGKTPDQINEYLSAFDKWDRYDYNGNGNFDEPDGYIDTFQSVHAGEGEEAGGGVLGEQAIWSHSWYAFSNLIGKAGPSFNKYGGIQIGDSNYWVGKYTIQPENGGVGVFAHEFGHDLGLPDLYDTAGGDNGTAFWTLMSSGSWLNEGKDGIGSMPNHMGAWEKFELGWLNYQVVAAGRTSAVKLGPAETNTRQAQGLFVVLPQKTVVSNVGTPKYGARYYYSGQGDNLDNFMFKSFNLAAGATLTAKVRYSIEKDWDYAYLVYSTDNGATWQDINTSRSTSTDPNGQNKGFGITGSTSGQWVDLSAALPVGNVLLGFRYWTDANTGGYGFMADEINVTGYPADGAETDAGWTFKPAIGFHASTGTESRLYDNYYLAEFRQYRGYDATLKTGPYNFGFTGDLANKVEHFPYQDGMLVSYWDTSQANNNTITHPGAGLILPVDAHPTALKRTDGSVWRNRIQSYDATFGLEPTDALTLHYKDAAYSYPSLNAVSTFDDRNSYWDAANPLGSVKVPNTGTQIRVVGYSALDNFMQIEVRPAK